MDLRGAELEDIVPGVVLVEVLLVMLGLAPGIEEWGAVARIAVVDARRDCREVDILVGGTLAVVSVAR